MTTKNIVKPVAVGVGAMTAGAAIGLIGFALIVGTWDWYQNEVKPAKKKR